MCVCVFTACPEAKWVSITAHQVCTLRPTVVTAVVSQSEEKLTKLRTFTGCLMMVGSVFMSEPLSSPDTAAGDGCAQA